MNEVVDAIVRRYLAAAIGDAEATDSGDSKLGNECYDEMMRALHELDGIREDGRDALLNLLDHDNPRVRGLAATHLLKRHQTRALAVLEDVARLRGIAGFNAKIVLDEWRKGTLKIP